MGGSIISPVIALGRERGGKQDIPSLSADTSPVASSICEPIAQPLQSCSAL
uniref:Uncharacterized protein n=1 Tax=Anguilla anguilla TaxID=7936 RepID=A0A0E9SC45_ANGAN